MAATKEQAKASKAAAAKIKAKGVEPYKHESNLATSDPEGHRQAQADAQADAEGGVDTAPAGVVHSGFSVFNPTTQGQTMTEPTKPQNQVDREQAAKDKIAAKQAKLDAAAKTKADKAAAKAEADRVKAENKTKADAEKAAKREADAKARAEAAEKAKAEGKTVRERTYEGSMLTLADRAKAGAYVKGANGQLRSSDEVAVALETVPANKMVELLLSVLGLTVNPYAALNYGQQSMNLRNRLRGAIRKGAKAGEGENAPVITVARIIELRDAGDFKLPPPAVKPPKAENKAPAVEGSASEAVAQAEGTNDEPASESVAA